MTVILTRLVDLVKFRIWNVLVARLFYSWLPSVNMWRCQYGRSAVPARPGVSQPSLRGMLAPVLLEGGPARAIDAKGASLQLVLRKGMAKKVSNPKKTANTMQLFENYEKPCKIHCNDSLMSRKTCLNR